MEEKQVSTCNNSFPSYTPTLSHRSVSTGDTAPPPPSPLCHSSRPGGLPILMFSVSFRVLFLSIGKELLLLDTPFDPHAL